MAIVVYRSGIYKTESNVVGVRSDWVLWWQRMLLSGVDGGVHTWLLKEDLPVRIIGDAHESVLRAPGGSAFGEMLRDAKNAEWREQGLT